MKKSILFLLIIATLPLKGQDNRYYFGIYGSPDISEYVVLKGEPKQVINEMSKVRLAYTFGITTGIRINSVLSFETGMQYSLHGLRTEKVPLVTEEQEFTGTEAKEWISVGYLGIPLKLRFSKNGGKYYFTASAGISPNYRVVYKTIIKYYGNMSDVFKTSYDDGRKFTLTPVITAGIGYQLSERTHLIIEPAFQYDLISVAKDSHGHYWNLGLKTGLTYSF